MHFSQIASVTGLYTPALRLGVTGLSRAGKTVFITSLVRNLVSGGRLPFFSAQSEGRLMGAYLQPQPDVTLPRFDYEAQLAALTGNAHGQRSFALFEAIHFRLTLGAARRQITLGRERRSDRRRGGGFALRRCRPSCGCALGCARPSNWVRFCFHTASDTIQRPVPGTTALVCAAGTSRVCQVSSSNCFCLMYFFIHAALERF